MQREVSPVVTVVIVLVVLVVVAIVWMRYTAPESGTTMPPRGGRGRPGRQVERTGEAPRRGRRGGAVGEGRPGAAARGVVEQAAPGGEQ